MSNKNPTIEALLAHVFAEMHEANSDGFAERQRDFVFHMLDWREDLIRLCELYSRPEKFSVAEAESVVKAMLYHASGHIAEAARVYDTFLDPFETERKVGTSERSKDPP